MLRISARPFIGVQLYLKNKTFNFTLTTPSCYFKAPSAVQLLFYPLSNKKSRYESYENYYKICVRTFVNRFPGTAASVTPERSPALMMSFISAWPAPVRQAFTLNVWKKY